MKKASLIVVTVLSFAVQAQSIRIQGTDPSGKVQDLTLDGATITPLPSSAVPFTPPPAPVPNPPAPAPAPTPSSAPAVEYFGRFDSSQRMSWSGTAVKAHFRGTSVSGTIKNNAGDVNFTVVIDDGNPTIIKSKAGSTTKFALAVGLPNTEHTVLLMRNNESFFGSTQFQGFDFGSGTLLGPVAYSSPLKLEVYGDSITATTGSNPPCSNPASETQNAYLGYANKATRALGAQPPSLIAWSGRGIVNNPITGIYNKVLGNESAAWNFPSSTIPNVVLIALGTNDSGQSASALQSAYVSFAKTIRSKYSSAHIMFAIGPMNYSYQSAVLAAVQELSRSDNKISSMSFSQQKTIGCEYHPAEAQHTVMGNELAAALKKIGY
jgi:lysophospholipase L1-like esterase